MIPNPSQTEYDWPFYAAQHLSGEPDCTYVPQGYAYDFVAEDSRTSGTWLREGMMFRMYGKHTLNAHCN